MLSVVDREVYNTKILQVFLMMMTIGGCRLVMIELKRDDEQNYDCNYGYNHCSNYC